MSFAQKIRYAVEIKANRLVDTLHPRRLLWERFASQKSLQSVVTPLGRSLRVRVWSNDVIGRDIFVYGYHEKRMCRFLERYLKSGMIFFDLGANLGQYTLLAAHRVGIAGCVHAFEPSSRMFEELLFNVNLNRFSGICKLNRLAVADSSGIADFPVLEPGYEVYCSLGKQQRAPVAPLKYEQVPLITLKQYVEDNDISTINLIKMDIESGELSALRGAGKLLSGRNAPSIILEMNRLNTAGFGYSCNDLWEYLWDLDYDLHRVRRDGSLTTAISERPDFRQQEDIVAIKRCHRQMSVA